MGDYEREGLMGWFGAPEYEHLQEIVEPYRHLAELELPKYLINATGDQFFLPDSSQFYFDDLPGEKHLRYVPNTEHSLGGSDAAVGFEAFYQAVVEGVERPAGGWTATVDVPAQGWRAFFIELTFPGPGEAPFKFSTGVEVVPDALPDALPYEWPPAAAVKKAA